MITLSDIEQKAIDEYVLAHSVADAASDRLEAIFLVRVEPLLQKGEYDKVKEIITLMPDSVARMYVADALRVARGDFNK